MGVITLNLSNTLKVLVSSRFLNFKKFFKILKKKKKKKTRMNQVGLVNIEI